LSRNNDKDSDLPVSERIRSRLMRAKQRYHANDNISAYVMMEKWTRFEPRSKRRWPKC
jgi:hypothetical protein